MTKIAVLAAAALFAAPLAAQEEIYIYVNYKDASGASYSYKLDCLDSKCTASTNTAERTINLSEGQRDELLGALQAESKRFAVSLEPVAGDDLMKIRLKYYTPRKRLKIEHRVPADKPAGLSPEMIQVIKAHLDLDLSTPVSPKTAEQAPTSAKPGAQDQSK